MSIADDVLKRFGYVALAETQAPKTGQGATHGTATVAGIFGNVNARIGTYNPESIGQATFKKMERHFQVRVGLSLIYLPLLTARWTVDGPDPIVNEYVTSAIRPIWRALVRSAARTGVSRGCAPHEVVWERRDTQVTSELGGEQTVSGWVPSMVKDIEPATLKSILLDGFENFAGYEVGQPAGVILEGAKCFHFANELEFGNYWGTSRLVGAYEPWYRQQLLWDFAMRYMERRGTPTTKVMFPPGSAGDGTPNDQIAQEIASGLTTDDAAVWLPSVPDGTPGWDVSLLEDSQRSQGYLDILNAHNAWILRALMIPDKVFAQDDTVGSYSLAETHADMYLLGEDGLLLDIIDSLNDQIVSSMVRYTFGPEAAIPRIETPGLSDSTRAYMGDLFKLLVQGGQASLDADAMAEALGLPVAEESAQPDEEPENPEEPEGEVPEEEEEPEEEEPEQMAVRASLDDLRLLQRRARLLLAMRGE